METRSVSNPIINNYIMLIKADKKTINDVPPRLRQEVADILGISLEEITLEKAKETKIAEMSEACNTVIYTGMDVQLSTGVEHFSFDLKDQNNIESLFNSAVIVKIDGIPYHSDDMKCKLYTYLDIVRLYKSMQEYILYNTTYFNMLKNMIKESLTTVEEVQAIVYGSQLNEEYTLEMNKILEQSRVIYEKTLEQYGINLEDLAL